MPARRQHFAPGEVYHVVNRGALKITLFLSDHQYHLFIKLMHHYADRYKISVLALCLMPNHIHLLVRVEEGGDLSRFIGNTCAQFSRMVNQYLRRSGTIFQGRFHASHVSDDRYFKTALRYIHLNPVKAGLVTHPFGWEFSDFREAIGKRTYIQGDHQFVRAVFGGPGHYDAFVTADMQSNTFDSPEFLQDLSKTGLI